MTYISRSLRAAASLVLSAGFRVDAASVTASGDEWLLSNGAFSANSISATALAGNLITFIGGQNYLMLTDAPALFAYGTSFQSFLTGSGKTFTVNPAAPFSASLLQPYDAVFLAGTPGSGAANASLLSQYAQNGGTVYLSLGTGTIASTEAGAWNPLLNAWNLNAGSTYFTVQSTTNISTVPGSHALRNNVDFIRWGFGQEVTRLNSSDPRTEIALTASFGGSTGNRGAIGVTVVPEPSSSVFIICGVAVVMRRRSRRTIERNA